jgi:hypothetical protein
MLDRLRFEESSNFWEGFSAMRTKSLLQQVVDCKYLTTLLQAG